MSIFSKRAASVVFVGALSTFGGGIAYAEDGRADQPAKSAGAPAELEEIVVTARYRAESLQDTPISISALTANDLEARGITDVTGLTAVTPSTTLVKEGSTGGNTLVAYIRGLGQANYSLAFQPGVPIYVDDIYQPTAFGSMLTLGDIERVDVLRGPQGTLFGKNSEGGAVSIHQVDPKGDNSGYAEAGVGATTIAASVRRSIRRSSPIHCSCALPPAARTATAMSPLTTTPARTRTITGR